MKLTRLGGICGILAGISKGLEMFAYVFTRNYLESHPTSLPLAIAHPTSFLLIAIAIVSRVITLIPFPLFLLTLAGMGGHSGSA